MNSHNRNRSLLNLFDVAELLLRSLKLALSLHQLLLGDLRFLSGLLAHLLYILLALLGVVFPDNFEDLVRIVRSYRRFDLLAF